MSNTSYCPKCNKIVKVITSGFNLNGNIPIKCSICGRQLGVQKI